MAPNGLPSAKAPVVHHPSLQGATAKKAGHTTYVKPNFDQTKPLTTRPTGPAATATAPGPRRQARREVGSAASGQTHLYSRNWAGAIVPATGGKRFSLITASWAVPELGPKSAADNSYISIWIGLGGSSQASRSMPQMGSEHGWDGTTPVHRLWCQWWLGRDNAGGYLSDYLITPPGTLRAGDEVTCWLEVDATGLKVTYHWQLTRDRATREFSAEDTRGVPVRADTANWIVERPTEVIKNASKPSGYELGRHHPLPDLRDGLGKSLPSGGIGVTMKDCLARPGPGGPDEVVRRPVDGQLLSLRSIVPGASRSYIELEPAVAADRQSDLLRIVRHLP